MLIQIIEGVYRLLWGDLLTLHLGNVTLSLSFMVILLLTAGVFFTLRTRLLPVRLFRDMLAAVCEKSDKGSGLALSVGLAPASSPKGGAIGMSVSFRLDEQSTISRKQKCSAV